MRVDATGRPDAARAAGGDDDADPRDAIAHRRLTGVLRPRSDFAPPGREPRFQEARERLNEDFRRLAAATGGLRRRRLEGLPAAPALAARDAGEPVTPEQRLVSRITLGANQADLARIRELGYHGYLEEQLAWEDLDDSELEGLLAEHLPTLHMSPAQIVLAHREEPFVPVFHLWLATLFRSLYSRRQLLDSMSILWSDHFNIDIASDLQFFLKPVDQREVIRRHALGSFPRSSCAAAPTV